MSARSRESSDVNDGRDTVGLQQREEFLERAVAVSDSEDGHSSSLEILELQSDFLSLGPQIDEV
jgi:hypothetical protein